METLAFAIVALLILAFGMVSGRQLIFSVTVITVLMSVFAHGLTALPWAKRYGTYLEKMKHLPEVVEHLPVTEMPIRLPSAKKLGVQP